MISLRYWEHPLIVKAFRVKYRGGRMYVFTTAHLLLLFLVGVAFYRYQDLMSGYWARTYFLAMIGLQFVVSGAIAATAVSTSMQSEVVTRTLDFQRIAAIAPRQILLGKIVGEPASSYLLAVATIPIGVFCAALGAVSLPGLLLIYVSLATTTFMVAGVAIQHPLESAPGRPASGGAGAVGMLLFVAFSGFSLIMALIRGGSGFENFGGAIVGLFTPMLTIKELADLRLFENSFPIFDARIPYALLGPVVQVGIASFSLACMSRRLTSPLLTGTSKLQNYGLVATLDLLWAGLVWRDIWIVGSVVRPAILFLIGHLIVSVVAMTWATPRRETFQSWIWRFRGRRPALVDFVVGDRSLNYAVLLVHCLIGAAVLACALVGPAVVFDPRVSSGVQTPMIWIGLLIVCTVTVSYGLFYQMLAVTTSGRGVLVLFFFSLMIMAVVPMGFAEYFTMPVVGSLSPLSMIVWLLDNSVQAGRIEVFVGAHAVGAAFWAWTLIRLTSTQSESVRRKKVRMGALADTAAPPEGAVS